MLARLALVICLAGLSSTVPACTVEGAGRDGGAGFDAETSIRPDVTGGDRPDVRRAEDGSAPDAAADAGLGRVCEPERCSNGLDDDCDGTVDDGCACVPGEVLPCFRGAPSERALGTCADGRMTCTPTSDEFGVWGACTGDVLAASETCDAAGLDEDCDGAANEGCECTDGDPPRACGLGLGTCVPGTQRCEAGRLGACEGAIGPAAEGCDGRDEDCDGRIDEGLTEACGTDEGVCRSGLSRCALGAWGACEGGARPEDERCDGLDQDCDGRVDETVRRLCGSDVGRCVAGVELCEGGGFGACEGRVDPIAETCNGEDDDCDGLTDESVDRSCGTEVGECIAGIERCEDGRYGACTGSRGPATEACNGLDDDCDGTEDEGCSCVDGTTRRCGSDVGACRAGTARCAGGTWGPCEGDVEPAPETCDGRDDDCDGSTDEGYALGGTCEAGLGACLRGGNFVCRADGAGVECDARAGAASEERCNGLDDDCDGVTDDGNPEGGGSCDGADGDLCAEGTLSCLLGALRCSDSTGDSLETCNGRDDDCDGRLDEGFALGGGCTEGLGICLRSGTVICRADGAATVCSAAPGLASTETCNNLDDDCDGAIDDGDPGGGGACDGADGDLCAEGTLACTGGRLVCSDATGTSTELCNDLDDDCDGSTDEGCDCVSGRTRSCGTDVGVCVAGTETCDAAGRWGACTGAIGPSAEACNRLDDDCDGASDEDGVCVPPLVACPGAQSAATGAALVLVGGGSDPDGGSVTFAWTVTARPAGSAALPSPSSSATTSFTLDVAGTYTLRLCVTDDEGVSACCEATVSASDPCTPPSAPSLSACGVSWDRRPIVEFAPLPSGLTYALFQDGASSPYGTVTMVGQNYFRPAAPLGAGGPPPLGASTSITLRACRTSNPTCCATSAPVTVQLIEACTTPVPPTASNVVFSEYVIDGDGVPCSGPTCEAGEAIEITNLSHCPVALSGFHFSYCNGACTASSARWMDFGAADVIPPRGVYVAIRERAASMCSYPYFGPDEPGLFGLRVSSLAMQGTSLSSGWFSNSGGALSQLRVASGAYVSATDGATIDLVRPYLTSAAACESIGYDAVNACGDLVASDTPTSRLAPNQLGRLWHPCDAVVAPVPSACR
jgi:hypothetical protein